MKAVGVGPMKAVDVGPTKAVCVGPMKAVGVGPMKAVGVYDKGRPLMAGRGTLRDFRERQIRKRVRLWKVQSTTP